MTQRVAIFIDGSNLYHSLEENCGRMDLDFLGFGKKLVKDRDLFRVYYYNILQDPERKSQGYQDQQKFLSTLYNIPLFEVRLGTSKMRGDVMVEKGVDIMLATDLLQFAWRGLYDVAVLVTGDGDFTYAVQTVKNLGKYVEVAAFPSNLSWDLSQVADDRQYLDPEFFSDLWVTSKGSPATRRRRFRGKRGDRFTSAGGQPAGQSQPPAQPAPSPAAPPAPPPPSWGSGS